MPERLSRQKTVFVIGAMAVVVSCVFFWASVAAPNATQTLALIFTLIAEIVVTSWLCLVEGDTLKVNSPAWRLGSYLLTGFYFLLSFLVATVHIVSDLGTVGSLIGLEILFLGLFAGAEVGFLTRARAKSQDHALSRARSEAVVDLTVRLAAIRDRLPSCPEREIMEKILEEVRYFNKNVEVAEDGDISEKIDELSKVIPEGRLSPPPEVGAILGELLSLARRRMEMSAIAQRGRA
ncbi:MAG: hypothetical protein LBR11_03810 [Deltaproteobacteria bacterium]|jgi:hypothetical protein|nr:hypothetical protein [Deltaproteobacteria bacterium]